MTVQELFDQTIGMMGMISANATTYADAFPKQVNTVLAECFKLENNNREFKGIAVLTSIPKVTGMTDILEYQDELTLTMTYGLAMYLALSDDDTIKAGFFNQQYVDERAKAGKMIRKAITDYFSAEDETLL